MLHLSHKQARLSLIGASKWKDGWNTTWSCIQLRIASEATLNSIQLMPIMVEIVSEPTASEIEKAINGLANGKASGNDAIPLRSDQTKDTSPTS